MFGLNGVQSRRTLRPISARFRVPFIGPIPFILSQNLKKEENSKMSFPNFMLNVDNFPNQRALGPDAYKLLKCVTSCPFPNC